MKYKKEIITGGIVLIVLVSLYGIYKYFKKDTSVGVNNFQQALSEFNSTANYAAGNLITGIRSGTISGNASDGEDLVFAWIKKATPAQVTLIRNTILNFKEDQNEIQRLANIGVVENIHQFHTLILREAIKKQFPNVIF